MPEPDWKKLKDYRCPIDGCNSPLREIKDTLIPKKIIHVCTSCNFHITESRLSEMVIIRHRKLQPPAFIEEMMNQEELNNL